MKILITGGTGFVGSHIVDAALANGDFPIVAKRKNSSTRWLPVEKIEFVEYSTEDYSGLKPLLPTLDAVVHCAGITKAKNKSDFIRVNTDGTRKLIELCAEGCSNLKRFVLISSQAASCPGCAENKVCESTPSSPISAYGESKLLAEQIVKSFADKIPVTIIRPPTVYGPRDTEVMIYFKMVKSGFLPFAGNPSRQFSIVYASDLAKAVMLTLRIPHKSGSTYFVTDGTPHDWDEFGDAIAKALGVKPLKMLFPKIALYPIAAITEIISRITGKPHPLSFDKAREMSLDWVCDDSLIRKELGYKEEFDLEKGIAETVKWMIESKR
jgi:nucleoside-diphosphate-sugar epimerase